MAIVGSIALTFTGSTGDAVPTDVEVRIVPVLAGSSGGVNGTNGTASLVGATSLLTTTNIWALENLNATGEYYAQLRLRSSSGVSSIVTLAVGINNGTEHDMITGSLGLIDQTTAAPVRLAPGSTNNIYVKHLMNIAGPDTALVMDVIVSDSAAQNAAIFMRANLTIT